MDNTALAGLLYELGTLTARSDADGRRFRAEAYRRAAAAVHALEVPVTSLDDASLQAVPGIGAGVAARIREAATTGRIRRLDELRARDPAGAEALLRVPGLGPRTVARLRDALGVTDVAGLRRALDAGTVRSVRGVGPATETRLRASLASLALDRDLPETPLADAVGVAGRAAAALRGLPGVTDVRWTGGLRRFRPTLARIDLLVTTAARPPDVADRVVRLPLLRPGARVTADGPLLRVEGATHDGPPLVVHVVAGDGRGGPPPSALLWTTGDAAYLAALRRRAAAQGLVLDGRGLREDPGRRVGGGRATGSTDGAADGFPDEDALHAALGLQPVPPERREGADVVALAARGGLPCTAEVTDLRGDLHDHTDWSGDGRMPLAHLVDAARTRGWSYVAVTDHAEGLRMNGLDRAAMRAQRTAVRAVRARHDDIAVLHGAELNIDAEGGLDYDAAFLAGFDWAVASIHSHFGLDADAQTRRLLRAVHHPAVRAIGHLSGRRIGRRPGITFDVDAVLRACRETGTALEINCHLDRLDATDDVLREAAGQGVLTVISTDAHRLGDLDQHRWGVAWARRGGVPRDLVTNTWDASRFLDWARAAA